jgi:hypothetical protein
MRHFTILFMWFLLLSPAAWSADTPEFRLAIENHRFDPQVLEVPAGQRIRLVIDNRDASAEEFESHQLNREKVIPGGTQAVMFIGPLDAGEYPFVGEFHEDSATGRIIAR